MGYVPLIKKFLLFSSGGKAVHTSRAEPLLFEILGASMVKEFSIFTCRGKLGHACLTFLFLCDGPGTSDQEVSPPFARGEKLCTRPERNAYFLEPWGQTFGQGATHFHMSGQARARVLDISVSLRWAGCL